MNESLFKLVQACTNSETICMGMLRILQACTNLWNSMYRNRY